MEAHRVREFLSADFRDGQRHVKPVFVFSDRCHSRGKLKVSRSSKAAPSALSGSSGADFVRGRREGSRAAMANGFDVFDVDNG